MTASSSCVTRTRKHFQFYFKRRGAAQTGLEFLGSCNSPVSAPEQLRPQGWNTVTGLISFMSRTTFQPNSEVLGIGKRRIRKAQNPWWSLDSHPQANRVYNYEAVFLPFLFSPRPCQGLLGSFFPLVLTDRPFSSFLRAALTAVSHPPDLPCHSLVFKPVPTLIQSPAALGITFKRLLL